MQSAACPPTLNHRRLPWEPANPVTVEGCGAGAYQCVSRTAAAILPRHSPLSQLGSPEALSLLTSAADISRHDSGHIASWLIATMYLHQGQQLNMRLQHRGRTRAENQQNLPLWAWHYNSNCIAIKIACIAILLFRLYCPPLSEKTKIKGVTLKKRGRVILKPKIKKVSIAYLLHFSNDLVFFFKESSQLYDYSSRNLSKNIAFK